MNAILQKCELGHTPTLAAIHQVIVKSVVGAFTICYTMLCLQGQSTGRQRMFLSIVVPLFNEEESVEAMHAAIASAMSEVNYLYEIIFVDDGSKDRTFELAKEIALQDPNLRLVRFRRNYGQTPAMARQILH